MESIMNKKSPRQTSPGCVWGGWCVDHSSHVLVSKNPTAGCGSRPAEGCKLLEADNFVALESTCLKEARSRPMLTCKNKWRRRTSPLQSKATPQHGRPPAMILGRATHPEGRSAAVLAATSYWTWFVYNEDTKQKKPTASKWNTKIRLFSAKMPVFNRFWVCWKPMHSEQYC